MLHDDVAAHTARIRSVLRQTLWKYNDYVAVRRALDQRHKLVTKWQRGCEVQAEGHLLNSGVLVERSRNHSGSNSRELLSGHARKCRQG